MIRNLVLIFIFFLISPSGLISRNIIPVFSSDNESGFIENKGQIYDQNGNQNNKIIALYPAGGFNLLLSKDGFSYDIYEFDAIRTGSDNSEKFQLPGYPEIKYQRIDVQFINPDAGLKIIMDDTISYRNYYNRVNYPDGILNVAVYNRVLFSNLYPGIDLLFYMVVKDGKTRLKYNFILKPGADLNRIKLKYQGVPFSLIDGSENIFNRIQFSMIRGKFTESIPSSWFIDQNNQITFTKAGYKNLGNGIIGFTTASGDIINKSLIIDPVPLYDWGSYFGGTNDDYARCIKSDKKGNLFMCGYTYSLDCIATSGAFMSVFGGGSFDGFVAKINSTGHKIWASYFGGPSNDDVCSETFDNYGNFYLAGYTRSTSNITTTGSFQPTFGGGYIDAFLVKFDSTGIRKWSTYIGGSGYDWGYTTTADENDNIYIAGRTTSINNIATSGCYQFIPGGNSDAFIQKFTTTGSRIWGTYLGGEGDDYGFSLTYDSNSYIYLAGHTSSTGGISYGNSYQTYFGGGNMDVFLAKICTCGPLVWSTYYGGNDDDEGWSVTSDYKGYLYVSGVTSSLNGISTPGCYQDTLNRNSDAFLAKFSDYGNRVWGTYFGGDSSDGGLSVVYSSNRIHITGYTFSSDLKSPVVNNDSFHGSCDAFIATFDASGKSKWLEYIGGTDYDEALSITSDSKNSIYICGYTGSSSGIATSGALQDTFGGGNFDVFIKKFRDPCYGFGATSSFIKDAACFGMNSGSAGVKISAGNPPFRYLWSNGDTTATVSDLFAGKYVCYIIDSLDCTDSVTVIIKTPDSVVVVADHRDVTCSGANDGFIHLNVSGGNPPYSFIWDNKDTLRNIDSLFADIYRCIITDMNKCTDTILCSITEPVKITLTPAIKEPLCYSDSNGEILLNVAGGIPPYRRLWWNGDTSLAIYGLKSDFYSITVTDSNNCSVNENIFVNQPEKIKIVFEKKDDTGACTGMARAIISGGSGKYYYLWSPGHFTDSVIFNLCFGRYNLLVTDSNSCKVQDSIDILNLTAIKSDGNAGQITFYPNPAENFLFFNLNHLYNNLTINFSDLSGKIIMTQKLSAENKETVDITGLHNGYYLITISTPELIIGQYKLLIEK
jgi:hypothetical protein